MKKLWQVFGLCFCIVVAASPAMTGNVIVLDIDITGLESFDLGAFDLDVDYDENSYEFHDYFLTDALGSISFGDAEDWSFGNNDTAGTVNLSILSYLDDLGYQPSAFTLATLVFSGDDAPVALNDMPAEFNLSINELSDSFGDAIPFTISGTEINAVPAPAAAWLLGSGLIGLVGIRRHRRS